MPTRIVTLSQLALLPKGTLVCHVNADSDGVAEFDIQGTLQVGPPHHLTGVDESWVELTPALPDVKVVDGRVETGFPPTDYCRNSNYPHRFVAYSDMDLRRSKS